MPTLGELYDRGEDKYLEEREEHFMGLVKPYMQIVASMLDKTDLGDMDDEFLKDLALTALRLHTQTQNACLEHAQDSWDRIEALLATAEDDFED